MQGWWSSERHGETTYAWSYAKASDLWVRLPPREDLLLELRLRPLPESPPQGVAVYANGQRVGEVGLTWPDWHLYTIRVPKTALTPGLNHFRFVYRYGTSPAALYPGSQDTRQIAVGFDSLRFRSE
jgi:hypothetical protein